MHRKPNPSLRPKDSPSSLKFERAGAFPINNEINCHSPTVVITASPPTTADAKRKVASVVVTKGNGLSVVPND